MTKKIKAPSRKATKAEIAAYEVFRDAIPEWKQLMIYVREADADLKMAGDQRRHPKATEIFVLSDKVDKMLSNAGYVFGSGDIRIAL